MEEKFEWTENGVFQLTSGQPFTPMAHSTTIYNEGGCELTAIFQVGYLISGYPSLSLSLVAKPRQPPMLNLSLKVIRQGFIFETQSQKRIIFDKQMNLNDENFWRSTPGRSLITFEKKLNFYEELYYKFFINFTFVKPESLVKPSVFPLVDGPTFQDLLIDTKIMDETSDFKIVCQGEELKCHKLVLSMRSDFFKKMFNNRDYKESNEGIMTTTDFTGKTMKSFLKYLYTDSIDQDEIDHYLLRAAHLYDFKKLISECVRGLSMKINDDNVEDMLKIALLLELPTLLEEAKKKMKEKWQNWRESENQKREAQMNQLLGSMAIGQDMNLDMEGFDEVLKTHLNEYFQKK